MERYIPCGHGSLRCLQDTVAHLVDRTYLRGGGGIAALEAYHAGAVRTLLLHQSAAAPPPFNVSMFSNTAVRAAQGCCLSGSVGSLEHSAPTWSASRRGGVGSEAG